MGKAQDECFFITRIGEEGSAEREQSDGILVAVIEPAALELDLKVVRADHIAEPGQITSQIIGHLIEAPVVVADLSGGNPNVYYELGVRQALGKLAVLLAEEGSQLPFDTSQMRTIFYDPGNLVSAGEARKQLVEHIKNGLNDPGETPITAAVDIQTLRAGGPVERQLADLVQSVESLSRDSQDLKERVGRLTVSRDRVSEAALDFLDDITDDLLTYAARDPGRLDTERLALDLADVNRYLQRRLRGQSVTDDDLPGWEFSARPESLRRPPQSNFVFSHTISGGRAHLYLNIRIGVDQLFLCAVTRPDGTSATTKALRPKKADPGTNFTQLVSTVYPDDFDAAGDLPTGSYRVDWLPQPKPQRRGAHIAALATPSIASGTFLIHR